MDFLAIKKYLLACIVVGHGKVLWDSSLKQFLASNRRMGTI